MEKDQKNALKYFILYFLVLLIGGLIYFLNTTGDNGVSGADAMSIATTRPLYWILIGISVALNTLCVYFIIGKHVDGGLLHFLIFGMCILLLLTIFIAPANIKADPIGSGVTSEQMIHLREKGFK